MTHMKAKLAVAGLVFAVAVGYLGFTGVSKGWTYSVSVDTYVEKPEYRSQRVQLRGKVAEEGVAVDKAALKAEFPLLGRTAATSVKVAYHGVVPDLFKPGCEVVVEGKSGADGVFHADVLMTKCASKYEEEQHPKGDGSAQGARTH